MADSGSCHKVAMDFNRKHGKNITHDTVAKLSEKFEKTEVLQINRGFRPRTSTDEGTTDVCWVDLHGVPKNLQEGWLQKAV
jgi:hypothetical protein